MADRQFKPDLRGSDETLDDLLRRLRSRSWAPKGSPPGFEHFVTSRRPPRGAGGAEAPVPIERALPDLYAPI